MIPATKSRLLSRAAALEAALARYRAKRAEMDAAAERLSIELTRIRLALLNGQKTTP